MRGSRGERAAVERADPPPELLEERAAVGDPAGELLGSPLHSASAASAIVSTGSIIEGSIHFSTPAARTPR
jgi:hypothetical protein